MTYEQLENAMESYGYNLAGLTPEEVEAIAEAEGFRKAQNGKYKYNG